MTKTNEFDFKKAIEELEDINEWFQEEDIDLDEGLKKLRSGKELILKCQQRLKDVETEFIDIKNELDQVQDTSEELEDIELDFE